MGREIREQHTAFPRHRGFTLVELLVVIAIISMLAGMLLPVLGKALRMARLATCTSSLKQLYLGCFNYGADYNGYLSNDCYWYYVHPEKTINTLATYGAGTITQNSAGKAIWPFKGTWTQTWQCPPSTSWISSSGRPVNVYLFGNEQGLDAMTLTRARLSERFSRGQAALVCD